jgi:hypothetical protein
MKLLPMNAELLMARAKPIVSCCTMVLLLALGASGSMVLRHSTISNETIPTGNIDYRQQSTLFEADRVQNSSTQHGCLKHTKC